VELLERASQDAVVAAWLAAEIDSSRFSPQLNAILARHGQEVRVLREPDIGSVSENAYRRKVLGECRGFGRPSGAGEAWLAGRDVDDLDWWRVQLRQAYPLLQIQFTDGGFWTEESDGTRLPAAHVRRLLDDVDRPEYDLPNLVRDAVQAGNSLAPMILIDAGPGSRVVVLEGHVRLVAYVMAVRAAPLMVDAFLGRSPTVVSWPEY
jgi:hypothetical protein